jgi:hypothetical protein
LGTKESAAVPIVTDDRLKALLAEDRITALTLDTNVFNGQRLNLKSAVLRAVASLKDRPFLLLLSGTVVREMQGHIAKTMEDALRIVKKAAGEALCAFGTENPTRDELLYQITGGRSPADAAAIRVGEFLKDSACEVLDDTSLVDATSLFEAYFDRLPPFSHGKKTEFPDALALHALDRAAIARGTGFLVVSEDGDWRAFCEKSQGLYLVPKVEKALSIIADAPIGLRKAVVAWLGDDQDGRVEIHEAISKHVGGLDVDVNADASSGAVEAFAWAPEVRSIDWPNEADIDLIETEVIAVGQFRVVVSVPVGIELRFSVELNFSVWDSVDKESVGMGGRTVEVDREEYVRVTVTIDLQGLGRQDEEVELVEFEMDIKALGVDLGEVEVFEPEDYEE